MLLCGEQALGVAQLARLGLFVAQAEGKGKASRERTAAEVEHARALHPAVANEGYVRGAAADVDEDSALSPDLLTGARTG